jgi:hypothetical protein
MTTVINLPTVPFAQCDFDPVRPSSVERMEGRRVEAQSTGTPYWVAKYRTGFLTREQSGFMAAFRTLCSDNGGVFAAYDIDRQKPLKYLGGFPAGFSGQGNVRSFINSRSVDIDTLPPFFELVPGDYLEIRRTLLVRSLHLVTEHVIASAAGRATVNFNYPIDLQHFKVPSSVHFEQASCLMQIDAGSWSATKSMQDRPVSFSATEVFFYE